MSLSVPLVGRGPWIRIVALRIEEQREESEPFDVVEMQMCEEQVDLVERLLCELAAELADAGAGVDHDDRAAGAPHLEARRVAAVADSGRARCCERAPASPDPCLHRGRNRRRRAGGAVVCSFRTCPGDCPRDMSGPAVSTTIARWRCDETRRWSC